jgi:hypothetical protein
MTTPPMQVSTIVLPSPNLNQIDVHKFTVLYISLVFDSSCVFFDSQLVVSTVSPPAHLTAQLVLMPSSSPRFQLTSGKASQ